MLQLDSIRLRTVLIPVWHRAINFDTRIQCAYLEDNIWFPRQATSLMNIKKVEESDRTLQAQLADWTGRKTRNTKCIRIPTNHSHSKHLAARRTGSSKAGIKRGPPWFYEHRYWSATRTTYWLGSKTFFRKRLLFWKIYFFVPFSYGWIISNNTLTHRRREFSTLSDVLFRRHPVVLVREMHIDLSSLLLSHSLNFFRSSLSLARQPFLSFATTGTSNCTKKVWMVE